MEKNTYNHAYEDIIHLQNPTSRNHPRMSPESRAAQFSPFAALTGHDAAIRETARLTEQKLELEEDALARFNEKLNFISKNMEARQPVTLTYFVPDKKKSGGTYVSCSVIVKRIDQYERVIIMEDNTTIPIGQISDIEDSR